MAISATLLSGRSAADHADRRRGSWAFERAIIRHQRKGIAAAMDDRATAIPMVGGSSLDEPQPQKEEPKRRGWYTTQRGVRTSATTPTKRHMMPLGLVPGVRTQGLGWPCQEVHLCATHVIVATASLFWPYIYGINDEAVNRYHAICSKRG